MSEAAAAAPGGGGPPDSAAGRLLGVFLSPARTFASIAKRPTWLLPVAIWACLALPLSELILSRTDWRATLAEKMARSERHLSEAQLDAMVEQMHRITWAFDIFAVVFPLLLVVIVAGVLWAACHAFGWEVRFRQSMGVTAHAFFPGVLVSIGLLVALWNRPTIDPETVGDALYTNLGFLVDAHKEKVLHGLLASIDLLSFWTMALIVLGLSAAIPARRGRVAALVVSLWALFVIGKAGVMAAFG